MRHLKAFVSALIIGLILLMVTDYVALAATGRTLVIGKINRSATTTTLKATKGSALKLTTNAGQPPLKVNRKTKVKKLNADLVDGKSAKELGVRTRTYSRSINLTSINSFAAATSTVPAGTYLLTLSGVLNFPSDADVECVASSDASGENFVDVYTATDARGFVSLNAAGLAILTSRGAIKVECFSSLTGDVVSQPRSPIRVSLTSIDDLTSSAFGTPS